MSRDNEAFYQSQDKIERLIEKKGENNQRTESPKKPNQEQENEEISFIKSTKISALERRKCRTRGRMSSFITEKILNGEQLT